MVIVERSFEAASNYCKSEYFQKKGTYQKLEEEFYKLDENSNKIRKRIEGDTLTVGPFEY
ncbi:14434_t:CDS:2, partial [Dentiscutata erythropus]